MDDLEYLIEGAYDLHVHSAPDVLPRKMDDIGMAKRVLQSGMAGFVIKSHYFCTSGRASLVNAMLPGCGAAGSITLNRSVGGINPAAVEMAGRSGARLVWFPTCDARHERSYVFDGKPGKKMPYWAKVLIQMQEEGVDAPAIYLLGQDGRLLPEVYDVLDIMAKHQMVLATSHLSHSECFALVKAAKERKVERVMITHADFPTTFYSIEEQKELAKYGAYIEHCYTTWATGKVDFLESERQIKALGAGRVILSTDLGQENAIYPDEGLLAYAARLAGGGMGASEIRKMTVENPAALLNR